MLKVDKNKILEKLSIVNNGLANLLLDSKLENSEYIKKKNKLLKIQKKLVKNVHRKPLIKRMEKYFVFLKRKKNEKKVNDILNNTYSEKQIKRFEYMSSDYRKKLKATEDRLRYIEKNPIDEIDIVIDNTIIHTFDVYNELSNEIVLLVKKIDFLEKQIEYMKIFQKE